MYAALLLVLTLTGALGGPRDPSEVEDVLVAAFRSQMAEIFANKAAQFSEEPVICVGVTEQGRPRDPGETLLKRLAADPSVRPASRCVIDDEVARDKETRREAVILRAGSIEWLREDEAHVEMSYYRSSVTRSALTIRVVREPHGWIGLGPTWKGAIPDAGAAR